VPVSSQRLVITVSYAATLDAGAVHQNLL
jgi:hypothetical protein